MLAEWTIFTQVSGVQWCPRSSRQVAADDLRPVHAIVVAGRAARPLQRAHPLRALLLPRADERAVVDVVQRRHVERVEYRVVEGRKRFESAAEGRKQFLDVCGGPA